MKTEMLTNFNGEPGKITCIVKVDKDILSEHTKSRRDPSTTNTFECYLHSSVGDTVILHIEADAATADFFDVYCDGILRFTQPNPNVEKKSKVDIKKVYYTVKGSNKKNSDGIRLCDMEIQARDKSHDIDDFTISSEVGTITVKCWQKLPDAGASNKADNSETFPSFLDHHEWHDLGSNARMGISRPELQLGFIKPRNISKTAKPGTLAEDVEAAAKRNPSTFLHFCNLVFHIRTTAELNALGLDVSDRSKVPKPIKKSKKVTIADQAEDEVEDEDEESVVYEQIPLLPEAALRLLLPFFEVDGSYGQEADVVDIEISRTEAHVQNAMLAKASGSMSSSVNNPDIENSFVIPSHSSTAEKLPEPNEAMSVLTPKPNLISEESLLFRSIQNTDPLTVADDSPNIEGDLVVDRRDSSHLTETTEGFQAIVPTRPIEPKPVDENVEAHDLQQEEVTIDGDKAPNDVETISPSTKQSRVLKGLACAPAMEAFRKRDTRLAEEKSVDLDDDTIPAIDANESVENQPDEMISQMFIPPSFLMTAPGTAKNSQSFPPLFLRPAHIDAELEVTENAIRLPPKTFSQATTATWSQSVGNFTNPDGVADPLAPENAEGIVIDDDAKTEVAPEEDALRAVDASRVSREPSLTSDLGFNKRSRESEYVNFDPFMQRTSEPATTPSTQSSKSRNDKGFSYDAISNLLIAENLPPSDVLSMFTYPANSKSSARFRTGSAGLTRTTSSASTTANKRPIKRSSLPEPPVNKAKQKSRQPTAASVFLSRVAAEEAAEDKSHGNAQKLTARSNTRSPSYGFVASVPPAGLPASNESLKRTSDDSGLNRRPQKVQKVGPASRPSRLSFSQSTSADISQESSEHEEQTTVQPSLVKASRSSHGQLVRPIHNSTTPAAQTLPARKSKTSTETGLQETKSAAGPNRAGNMQEDLDAKYEASEAKLKEAKSNVEKIRQQHAKLRKIRENTKKLDQLKAEQAQIQREIEEMEATH